MGTSVHALVLEVLDAMVGGNPAVIQASFEQMHNELQANADALAVRTLARDMAQLAYYFDVEVGDRAACDRIINALRAAWPHVFPKLAATGEPDRRVQAAIKKQHAAKSAGAGLLQDGLRPTSSAAAGLRRGKQR